MSKRYEREAVAGPQEITSLVRATAAGVLFALAGCSPLPGPSFDPMYFKVWGVGVQGAPGTATQQSGQAAQSEARSIGPSEWVGRYQDSRGSGDVAASLVRGESTVSGIWRLRTGGGGPFTGTPEAGGRRLRLRMENTAPGCPGLFEGWMEIAETGLAGTYDGRDCEGPVSDGRLELHPRK